MVVKLNEYQEKAHRTAQYPDLGKNLFYPTMKLAGEAGEFSEKVGKLWRNRGLSNPSEFTKEDVDSLAKELGDVLWYVAENATILGLDLDQIAEANLAKLADREDRGVIKSQGDDR